MGRDHAGRSQEWGSASLGDDVLLCSGMGETRRLTMGKVDLDNFVHTFSCYVGARSPSSGN